MVEVLFYHLERASLESVLPDLLEKSLERNWRCVVKVGLSERIAALDNLLWTYRDESFLPHAAAGEGAGQPIWLTEDDDRPNNPDILFLVDGGGAEPASLEDLKRCVMIFDGRDEDALSGARGFWKKSAAAGHDVTYWKQSDSGRWEKQ